MALQDEEDNDQLKTNVPADKTRGSSCATQTAVNQPTYIVTDVPPWYLCIFLAFQVGATHFIVNEMISLKKLTVFLQLCLTYFTTAQ